jgi:hypothetical protein
MGLLDRTGRISRRAVQSPLVVQHVQLGVAESGCRIDGTLVLTNITFPDSVTSMDVTLANQDNTTSWWDDISVFNDNVTNTFSITPSNFTAFVAP